MARTPCHSVHSDYNTSCIVLKMARVCCPAATGALASSMKRGGGGLLTATREVNSLNRRAAHLLQQQAELEAAAEARWRASLAASGDAWIGDHLDTVRDRWCPSILSRAGAIFL